VVFEFPAAATGAIDAYYRAKEMLDVFARRARATVERRS
jgi:hypothetical protein